MTTLQDNIVESENFIIFSSITIRTLIDYAKQKLICHQGAWLLLKLVAKLALYIVRYLTDTCPQWSSDLAKLGWFDTGV